MLPISLKEPMCKSLLSFLGPNSCTCSETLRCGGSSQRPCGTRAPPVPSSAGCPSWGRHSTCHLTAARPCDSISALPRSPGGWESVKVASSLGKEKKQSMREIQRIKPVQQLISFTAELPSGGRERSSLWILTL